MSGHQTGFEWAPMTSTERERITEYVADPIHIEDIFPLSPVQEAMLYHTLAAEADGLYAVQQQIHLDGDLDRPAFEEAWALVFGRHQALRSVFGWRHQGRPGRIVCADLELSVEFVDLRSEPDSEARLAEAIEADRRRHFELDAPPLMRVTVLRTGDQQHEMLWTQHHLLQDGWSATTVLSEVFDSYEARVAGRRPELVDPPSHPDYLAWLAQLDGQATETYWRNRLAGFTHPTLMVERGAQQEPGGYVRLDRMLGSEVSDGLRRFAREHRLTLNTVLTGALAILLSRHQNRTDVAFGVVASGRPPTLVGAESMVGMFINTLLSRAQVDREAPLIEWLGAVQGDQFDMLEHQHCPITTVQGWSELGPSSTLTDVLFAYWGFGGSDTTSERTLRYRTVSGYGRTSYPFSITVEASDPIRIGLDLDRADYDAARGEQFLEQYATLLDSMVAQPHAQVGDLEVLTPNEQANLASYNDTWREFPHQTVTEAFSQQVQSTPNDVAVVDGDRTLSFGELDRAADQLAGAIRAVTTAAAPRVALYLPRSAELVVGIWGSLKANGSYVPIERRTPPERVRRLVAASDADLVLTTAQLRDNLNNGGPPSILLPLPSDGVAPPPPAEPEPDDVAYVIYTSGSTGEPKGVVVTHRGLYNYGWWAREMYGVGEPVTFPFYSSVGFDLTVTSLYVPLLSGGQIVIYGDDDDRDLAILDVFDEDRVDVVKLTPSHLALLEPSQLATERISKLVLGGEQLSTALADTAIEASGARLEIFNEYGPTETTVGCMIHRYDPSVDKGPAVPIGRPAANARIHLLNGMRQPVPDGAAGEIYVAGSGVAAGYLHNPGMTAEQFLPEVGAGFGSRMYRTGDLARWVRPGVIEYLGRADDQFKIRGFRVEPAEIESILDRHEGVDRAAVTVRDMRPGDPDLVAFYVPVAEPVGAAELEAHLRRSLPDFMVARHFMALDEVPLTANGKLERAALPDPAAPQPSPPATIGPRSEAERLVAATASELLGTDNLDLNENFFDLGGHSLLAMRLVARLLDATGTRISPRVVLLNSLAQAAALLPGSDLGSDHEEHRSPTVGAVTPFFFGPSDGQIFGIAHDPDPSVARRGAVLLCPPVGWEYMRTHWALRRLTRLLARSGNHVMRFDYFGTGDSWGDSGDATVARWIEDVAAAFDELVERSGVSHPVLIGVRLGGSLAALAAAERKIDAKQLVLWDPVVRGPGYLATLHAMHSEMLAERRAGPVSRNTLGTELLGFPYPAQLRRGLEAIDLGAIEWPSTPTTIVASEKRHQDARLSTTHQLAHDIVDDAAGWDQLAATQSALLLRAIPGHIADLVGAGP